ncbi:pyridoxal 5'-phosphate synthase glutaminase subunit PdxT [Microbacterium oryzae]|uniref:pyridoxal 5'-phosphate synthase glutaminase subunit PdxT n=1 Tax=Microbacterium oryzae TaxID=743009 RepID=UPI0025AF2A3B|nr:pyridoxal 5'-phosphate synthase glutaminase subunit PdxT [Microbacterium oryzae]MDN3309492.1 pyridoxal 5'-phosphate synthase glutaminase subunit PdxT [Microbacterium oryzae]
MSAAPRVGVLALQGDVREHVAVLEHLGARVTRVRRPSELAEVDGLVLPGGESSVIDKLTRAFELREPLVAALANGLPAYGTCAGLILLADRIEDGIPGQQTLGGLDVTVRRNAFGTQGDSFETGLAVPTLGAADVRATFIRAPIVSEVGARATELATLADGRVVAVEQGSLLGTSFHPEVTGEDRFHRRFLDHVRASA